MLLDDIIYDRKNCERFYVMVRICSAERDFNGVGLNAAILLHARVII